MEKIDIAKTNLYFKKLFNVLTTELNNQKIIRVNGRHSDAFVYVTKGSCTYTFPDDGYSITVNVGDILYLAHDAVYVMNISTPKYSSIYCDFEFDLSAKRKSAVYSPSNQFSAETLFHKLLKSFESFSKTSFNECMALLYNIHGVILMTANKEYIGKNAKNQIEEIKEYIDKNFKDQSLNISMLAEKAEMSEVYLRKVFKAQYDVVPSQYIISVRIEKAKELMKYPFLTLEACAVQSGFASSQYFCRVFKKVVGMSPGKYRSKYLKI